MSEKPADYKACSEDVLEDYGMYTSSACLTPTSDTARVELLVLACDPMPPAAPAPIIGRCEYYCWRYQNFELRHLDCEHDPPDYYLDYGLYYCRMFGAELYPKLAADGQRWLLNARRLLQEYMEIELAMDESIELDSDAFRQMAFDTHPRAYWEAGLGDLPFWSFQWAKIISTPDLSEWLNKSTWKQALIVGGWQVKYWIDQGVEGSAQAYDAAARKLESVSQRVKDFFIELF